MTNRREFLGYAGAATAAATLPLAKAVASARMLPTRLIPGTDEALPIIGMGNSNAFRQGDVETSWKVISMFQKHGSRYIDLGGPSRFVVAAGPRRTR